MATSWTIGRRLSAGAVAIICLVAGLFSLALWSNATAARWTDRVARVTDAQSDHQNLDMSHDAIFGIVVEGLLAARSNRADLLADAIDRLDAEQSRTVATLVDLESVDLSAGLHRDITSARVRLADYVSSGRAVLAGAANESAATDATFAEFLRSRDDLEQRLGDITKEFAASAAQLRADAERSRARTVRLLAVTTAAALAVTLLMYAVMYRSIHRSVLQQRRVSEDLMFNRDLLNALNMADTESSVYSVAARAMVELGESPTELLLADSSESHLHTAVAHPTVGQPGCGVEGPLHCAAVRRGTTLTFGSSEALDTCPRLSERLGGPYTAVCAPVTFVGRAIGVLHTARTSDQSFTPDEAGRVELLAAGIGTRLGSIRAFETTQLQASTDSLTGLANRRSTEEQLSRLIAGAHSFTLVLADLDRFKLLNDTYGHEMGDRWLRQFSAVAASSIRTTDLVGRWGGEEFVFVFPNSTVELATGLCERIRSELVLAAASANLPHITASFGMVSSGAAPTLDELFLIADQALYAAKVAGRDQISIGTT